MKVTTHIHSRNALESVSERFIERGGILVADITSDGYGLTVSAEELGGIPLLTITITDDETG